MFLVIQVVVCVVLVVLVAQRLSQSADILAEKSGLGHSWVGAILLAGATSLPELTTGMGAIIALDEPDLAAGGIFGSCLFNLLILALIDGLTGPVPLFQRIHISHGLTAGLGSILLGLAAAALLLVQMNIAPMLGWVSLASLLLFGLYMVSTRMIAQFELRRQTEVPDAGAELPRYAHIQPWRAYAMFGVLAAMIVVLGVWLAMLGDQVAEVTGLGETFVGALLLAASTSLPEVIASLEAVRMKALDLAVSNIFGSNIFNLAILGLYDLAYIQGNFWMNINMVYIFASVIAIIMTTVAIVGMVYREARRSPFNLSLNGFILIGLYLLGMYVIYQAS